MPCLHVIWTSCPWEAVTFLFLEFIQMESDSIYHFVFKSTYYWGASMLFIPSSSEYLKMHLFFCWCTFLSFPACLLTNTLKKKKNLLDKHLRLELWNRRVVIVLTSLETVKQFSKMYHLHCCQAMIENSGSSKSWIFVSSFYFCHSSVCEVVFCWFHCSINKHLHKYDKGTVERI